MTDVQPAPPGPGEPLLRLLGDLGSFNRAGRLDPGSGEVLVECTLTGLAELLERFGAAGFGALLAVLRHASADPGTGLQLSRSLLAPDTTPPLAALLADPVPASQPARGPLLRLRADLGTWRVGEPVDPGHGEVIVQCSVTTLESLLVSLGEDTFRALLAVLRHASLVEADGRRTFELPGYSGAWLRNHAGLGRDAAYRAAAALRDAGLLTTATLRGVRGAAGGQRAVLSPLVGLDDASVVTTRRGRPPRSRPAHPPADAASGTTGNRADPAGFPASGTTGNRETAAQVSAVSGPAGNRPSTARRDRREEDSFSLPERAPERAPERGGLRPAAARAVGMPAEDLMPLSAARSLWALQDALAAAEERDPGVVTRTLQPLVAARSEQAARLADALRLPGVEHAPTTRVVGFLVDVLGSSPATVHETAAGTAGAVLATLRRAGVRYPTRTAPELLLARLAVAVATGLDAAPREWKGWLGHGLKPDTGLAETPALVELRRLLDRAWRGELATPPPPARGDVAQHRPATAPDATPQDAAARPHAGLDDALVERLLPVAVAGTAYERWDRRRLAPTSALARTLVADYLTRHPEAAA